MEPSRFGGGDWKQLRYTIYGLINIDLACSFSNRPGEIGPGSFLDFALIDSLYGRSLYGLHHMLKHKWFLRADLLPHRNPDNILKFNFKSSVVCHHRPP